MSFDQADPEWEVFEWFCSQQEEEEEETKASCQFY